VYFSIDRFPDYGKLARLNLDAEDVSRVGADERKENPRDFVLWFSQSKFPNQIMKWDSPWGKGFPGWHIECSAMASHYLGERIDLHMGGIDHIPVHHTNEIAQSESGFGHPWVNYWAHCEFLIIDNEKMSKSESNFLRMKTVEDRGFDPLHFRYLCASAHYRSPLKFSWEALSSARDGFEALKNYVVGWKHQAAERKNSTSPAASPAESPPEALASYREQFREAIWNDFHTPQALGVLWIMARDSRLAPADKLALALEFDRVLGFGIEAFRRPELSVEVMAIIREREQARARKDWAASDAMREQLKARDIQLMDTPQGTDWYTLVRD
jgi:cysteinyl-tRNA synthetase